MAGLYAPSFLGSMADNGSVSGLSADSQPGIASMNWRTMMSKRTRLRTLLSLLIRARILPWGTSLIRHLSGDPFVLQVQRAIAPGLRRTLRHSGMLIHLQIFRTPESTKCILMCSMHLLDGPEVTIQTTLSLVFQVWLWPKECYIHQRLRDSLLRKSVPSWKSIWRWSQTRGWAWKVIFI